MKILERQRLFLTLELKGNYYHDYSRLNQIIKEKYNLKINVAFEEIEILEIDYERISNLKIALEYDFKTKYDDLDLVLFDYDIIIAYIEEASNVIIKDLQKKNLRKL